MLFSVAKTHNLTRGIIDALGFPCLVQLLYLRGTMKGTQRRVELKSNKMATAQTRLRLFFFPTMLAQNLGDFVIALFQRLVQRRFPLRVLCVYIRFFGQQQFYHLLFAANDSLMQKGDVLLILYVGVRASI